MSEDHVRTLILESLQEVNQEKPIDKRFEVSDHTKLLAKGSADGLARLWTTSRRCRTSSATPGQWVGYLRAAGVGPGTVCAATGEFSFNTSAFLIG
jgi:hypothetical protein